MKVMGNRVLVKRLAADPYGGTLEVIHFDEQPSEFALVVYTGLIQLKDGRKLELEVKPGDKVVTKQYCGTPVRINNQELFFVEYDDLLAVVDE